MKAQQMSIETKEGKKPIMAVEMGKASIPEPIQQPPMMSVVPKIEPFAGNCSDKIIP